MCSFVKLTFFSSLFFFGPFILSALGQVDDICREFGAIPTLDAPKLQAPFVYGKILVKGVETGSQVPKITITFSDASQPSVRQNLDRSGNYCFKRTGGDGTLVIHVDGFEYVRKTIPAFGQPQQREDFEITAAASKKSPSREIVSSKFYYDRSERSSQLFRKAAEAENEKDLQRALEIMKEVVQGDENDFIAWAKIGALHFERNELADAEAAFKRSLGLRVDYTPSWIFMGRIRVLQKQNEIAIEIFKQAIETDARSARAYQLLGETYLQAKRGTLGAEALNKAIELDPNGMAECHILLARLYDLAGAKQLASKEYKTFLAKRPEYAEKAKLEKYIKDNPE